MDKGTQLIINSLKPNTYAISLVSNKSCTRMARMNFHELLELQVHRESVLQLLSVDFLFEVWHFPF